MDNRKILGILSTSMLFISSCNFVAPQATPEPTLAPTRSALPQSEAEVPRVPVDQAKAASDGGAAVIVDVRSPQAYEASHVKGALSIPLSDIETNPDSVKLDKNQWIITYCT